MNYSRGVATFAASALVAFFWNACSTTSDSGPPGPIVAPLSDASAAGFGGTSTGGVYSAAGSTGTASGGRPIFGQNAGGMNNADPYSSRDCGAVSQKPEQITVFRDATVTDTIVTYEPVALYIMMDRSSSMIGVTGDPNSWPNATQALTNFVNDPASAGLDVGLGVFPDLPISDCSLPDTPCCSTPAICGPPIVPIGPLPANGANIIQGMQTATPTTFPILLTPTECALRGMIDTCIQHQNTTGEQCAAILVTDGTPTLCNGDPTALAQIVADGLAQGILTFTLGLPGSNLAFLNQLAEQGGTDCDPNGPNFACDLTMGSAGFLATLNSIRTAIVTQHTTQVSTPTVISTALDCQWRIPPPPPETTFDPLKVNLEYIPEGAPAGELFGYVESEAACAGASNAWYFDDPEDPKQIFVCPATCDRLKATTGGQVNIQLGCDRMIIVPK